MILRKLLICLSPLLLLLLQGIASGPAHAKTKSFDRYLLECASKEPLPRSTENLYIYLNDTVSGLRLEFSYAPSIDDVFSVRYVKGKLLTATTNERFTPPRIFSNSSDACLEYGGSDRESFFTGKIGNLSINRIAMSCLRLQPNQKRF